MTLDEYLNDKVFPPFSYQVTDDQLILSFDIITDKEVPAIHIRNEIDYKVFHSLLGARTINVMGNKLALGASYVLFQLQTWDVFYPIPTVNWT